MAETGESDNNATMLMKRMGIMMKKTYVKKEKIKPIVASEEGIVNIQLEEREIATSMAGWTEYLEDFVYLGPI